jgi:ribosomal protein S18
MSSKFNLDDDTITQGNNFFHETKENYYKDDIIRCHKKNIKVCKEQCGKECTTYCGKEDLHSYFELHCDQIDELEEKLGKDIATKLSKYLLELLHQYIDELDPNIKNSKKVEEISENNNSIASTVEKISVPINNTNSSAGKINANSSAGKINANSSANKVNEIPKKPILKILNSEIPTINKIINQIPTISDVNALPTRNKVIKNVTNIIPVVSEVINQALITNKINIVNTANLNNTNNNSTSNNIIETEELTNSEYSDSEIESDDDLECNNKSSSDTDNISKIPESNKTINSKIPKSDGVKKDQYEQLMEFDQKITNMVDFESLDFGLIFNPLVKKEVKYYKISDTYKILNEQKWEIATLDAVFRVIRSVIVKELDRCLNVVRGIDPVHKEYVDDKKYYMKSLKRTIRKLSHKSIISKYLEENKLLFQAEDDNLSDFKDIKIYQAFITENIYITETKIPGILRQECYLRFCKWYISKGGDPTHTYYYFNRHIKSLLEKLTSHKQNAKAKYFYCILKK